MAAISESGLTTDEIQIIKAAYNVLKKQYPQLTKQVILDSIDTYKGIIEQEKKNAAEQFEDLRKNRVGTKNAEIEALKTERTALEDEIKKKKEKLGEIAINLSKLEDEVQENTNDINLQISKFESSIKKVIQVLDGDKSKINSLNI
jgi:chromosome segregation ATPase